jgi:histidinol-phosphate aminotransferase
MYTFLLGKGIVLRDRSNVLLCDQCLRITVGTDAENEKLLETINEFS